MPYTLLSKHITEDNDIWELRGHCVGDRLAEYHSITKTMQKGKSTQNVCGGYSAYKIGNPKYIRPYWTDIKKIR